MAKKTMYHKLIKPEDGTIAITFDNKLHSWEGPALIPEGDYSRAEYYIYGIKKSKDEWRAAINDHTGLPWYKTPGILARF
jgi:hypothetical protein